jgi:uncharacterized protein
MEQESASMNTEQNAPAMPLPWWRVKMVWLVLGGPASVVVASLVTAVIAWRHIDPVITNTPQGQLRASDELPTPANPKDAFAPAMKARDHAASPQP